MESIFVPQDLDEAVKQAINHCLERGALSREDTVVVTFGHPHGRAKTNSLRILNVEEVLQAGGDLLAYQSALQSLEYMTRILEREISAFTASWATS